ILVGHADHDEVVGTMREAHDRMFLIADPEDVERLGVPDPDKVAYLTQTTLSVDDTRDCIEALRRRFPKIVGPSKDDICYATQNRQAAVKTVAGEVDVLLVIGAANSSNANRLVEVSRVMGTPSHLINDKHDIRPEWLEGARRVGVTAGASTPEFLVAEVVEELKCARPAEVREVPRARRLGVRQGPGRPAGHRGAGPPQARLSPQASAAGRAHPGAGPQRVLPRPQLRRSRRRAGRRRTRSPRVLHQARHRGGR